jgi:hypothetical protein
MFEDDWMFQFVFGHLHVEIKLAVEACYSPRTQTKTLELLIIDGKIKLLDTEKHVGELLGYLRYFLNFSVSVMCSIFDEETCIPSYRGWRYPACQ